MGVAKKALRCAAKRAQLRAILLDLKTREGLDIPWEEISAGRGEDAYVGRHHIASALIRRGKSKTRRKAFRRYLRFAPRAPDRTRVEGILQGCK